MTTHEPSPLDRLPGERLLDLLRSEAQSRVKEQAKLGIRRPLHELSAELALSLGYQRWSLLADRLNRDADADKRQCIAAIQRDPDLHARLCKRALRPDEVEEARHTMTAWLRPRYAPLQEWAFHDPESPNGYDDPGIDLAPVLDAHFHGIYPEHVIDRLAWDLEVEHGVWGDRLKPEPDEGDDQEP